MSIFKKRTKFEEFWEWFSEHEEFIRNNLEQNTDEVASLVTEKIKTIHPNIYFEIPFLVTNDKRDFIISADGDYDVFDEVIDLCDIAPTYTHWNIIPFRPRTYQEDQTIDMDGITLSYEDIYFQYDLTDLPIDVNVYIRGYDGKDNRFIHAYFILLDTLIGEFDAVTVIGETSVHTLTEEDIPNLIPIKKIRDLVDDLSVAN